MPDPEEEAEPPRSSISTSVVAYGPKQVDPYTQFDPSD